MDKEFSVEDLMRAFNTSRSVLYNYLELVPESYEFNKKLNVLDGLYSYSFNSDDVKVIYKIINLAKDHSDEEIKYILLEDLYKNNLINIFPTNGNVIVPYEVAKYINEADTSNILDLFSEISRYEDSYVCQFLSGGTPKRNKQNIDLFIHSVKNGYDKFFTSKYIVSYEDSNSDNGFYLHKDYYGEKTLSLGLDIENYVYFTEHSILSEIDIAKYNKNFFIFAKDVNLV